MTLRPATVGPSDVHSSRHARAALATTVVGGAWAVGARLTSIDLPCPLRALTGVPCPACGMTRLAGALLDGEVADAAARDPGGLVVLVVLALLALQHLLRRRPFVRAWMERRHRALVRIAAAGAAVHWVTFSWWGGVGAG